MSATPQDTGGGDRGLWLQLFPEDLRRLAQDRDTFAKYVYPLARWHMGLEYDPPEGPEADFIFGKLQDQQRRSAQSQQAKRDGAKLTNEKRWGSRRKRIGSESVATIQRPGSESNIDIDHNRTETERETGREDASGERAHALPADYVASLIRYAENMLGGNVPTRESEDYIRQYGHKAYSNLVVKVAANRSIKNKIGVFNQRITEAARGET